MTAPIDGTIVFHGNPWPSGHRLERLHWGASIDPPRGLSFELRLQSACYYAGEEAGYPFTQDDRDDLDDWHSKAAWANYHACRIAPSATSDRPGILVADGTAPFEVLAPEHRLRADPLPVDLAAFFAANAFSIYLLGHDAVADHDILLAQATEDGAYDLSWTARIALTYAGAEAFEHGFTVRARGLRFDSIALPTSPLEEPRDLLARYVANPDAYAFELRHGVRHAVPRPHSAP